MFLLTEIPVSDAQMYLKTRTTIKTGTVRTENNNHNNDRAIVCVVLFLVVGWLHMTTDGLVVVWRRAVLYWHPGEGEWMRHVPRNCLKSPILSGGKSKVAAKFLFGVLPYRRVWSFMAKFRKFSKNFHPVSPYARATVKILPYTGATGIVVSTSSAVSEKEQHTL